MTNWEERAFFNLWSLAYYWGFLAHPELVKYIRRFFLLSKMYFLVSKVSSKMSVLFQKYSQRCLCLSLTLSWPNISADSSTRFLALPWYITYHWYFKYLEMVSIGRFIENMCDEHIYLFGECWQNNYLNTCVSNSSTATRKIMQIGDRCGSRCEI